MRITVFDNIANKEKSEAVDKLITQSTPRQDFLLLVILSVLMASIGLLQNNVATVIGSMLIAPVLYPILGIAMGIVMANSQLIVRSLGTLAKSIIIGLGTAIVITLLVYPPGGIHAFQLTQEIALRMDPSLADVAIAIVSGLAASFALVKPQLSETLPGVAISVALVPPLAVLGIGIAVQDFVIASNALVLFIINILGIMFACVMVFSVMNFYVQRSEAKEVIKKEDKKLEREINGDSAKKK
ncbi:MAG TPA: TIGR00341 family protein [Candidatus Gracilibacteria bacterium]|nr:TIGR00341 family protein [Candidatus Gracilibacteria bacterium]